MSIGFGILSSLHHAIQTTGRLTFAPAGLPPAEHTSLNWTHSRDCHISNDRLMDGRGLRQRVLTQPGPKGEMCPFLATSHNHHQIFADDDLALEVLRHRSAPGFVIDAVDGRKEVRQQERFDAPFLGDATDIFGGYVVRLHMRHEGVEFHRPTLGNLVL